MDQINPDLVVLTLGRFIDEKNKTAMLNKLLPKIRPVMRVADFLTFLTTCKITSEIYRGNALIFYFRMASTPIVHFKEFLEILSKFSTMSHRFELLKYSVNKIYPPTWEEMYNILKNFRNDKNNMSGDALEVLLPHIRGQVTHELIYGLLISFDKNSQKLDWLKKILAMMPPIKTVATYKDYLEYIYEKDEETVKQEIIMLLISKLELTPEEKPEKKYDESKMIKYHIQIEGHPVKEVWLAKEDFKDRPWIEVDDESQTIKVRCFPDGHHEIGENHHIQI